MPTLTSMLGVFALWYTVEQVAGSASRALPALLVTTVAFGIYALLAEAADMRGK